MESLIIKETECTPFIHFDHEKGVLEIEGQSYDEDAFAFYTQLFNWVEVYKKKPHPTVVLNIALRYFNTGSAKCLADFLEKFDELRVENNVHTTVNWFYEEDDESMRDEIEEFSDLCGVEVNILERKRFAR